MNCTCYQSTPTAGDGRTECRKEGCAAVHNMEFAKAKLTPGPDLNNCSTCEYFNETAISQDEDGHCYMFSDEPTEVCMLHTGRKRDPEFMASLNAPHLNLTAMVMTIANLTPINPLVLDDLLDFPIPEKVDHDKECGTNRGDNCDCPALAPNRPEW